MRSRLVRFALASALASGVAGCTTVATLQTAHTAGKGSTQVALELGEQALVTRDTLRAYPVAGVAVRHGVSDRVDVGARVGPSGLEALAKIQLTPPPPSVVVSLAPTLAAYAWDPEGVKIRSFNVGVPVLVGLPFGEGHQVVLGPRVNMHFFSLSAGSARGSVDTVTAGGTVGIAWRMPGSRAVRTVTELGALRPVLTYVDRSDGIGGASLFTDRWTLQANLAFLLGGR